MALVLAGGFFTSPLTCLGQGAGIDPAALAEDKGAEKRLIQQKADQNLKELQQSDTYQEQANKLGTDEAKTTKTESVSDKDLKIPVLFHAIGAILYLILYVLNKLIALGAGLVEYILGITTFINAPVVTIGWGITRGLCNMGFALILLIMAFATILQIESFGMKKILVRLVLAALLINFSLMIAGILIDFAQVLTDYFIFQAAGPDSSITGNLMSGLQISKIYNLSVKEVSIWKIPSLQMLVEEAIGCVIFAIAAFSFFAMAGYLLIRIIAIWLLLIISPLAWLAMIVPSVPGVGNGWTKWWSEFFKWVFFAPIYSFFIYLALTIAQRGVGITARQIGTGVNVKAFGSSFFETPLILLQYGAIIALLLFGLQWGQKADIVPERLKKFRRGALDLASRWAARGGKIAGMDWVSKKIGPQRWSASQNKFFSGLGKGLQRTAATRQRLTSLASPDVWKRAWAASRTRAENWSFSQASGALQDMMSGKGLLKTLGGDTSGYYQNIERNKLIAQRQNEINSALPDENQRVQMYFRTTDPIEKEAILKSLGSTNSINTLLEEKFQQELNANPEMKKKAMELGGERKKIEAFSKNDNELAELNQMMFAKQISSDEYKKRFSELNAERDKLEKPTMTLEEVEKEEEKAGITALRKKWSIGFDFMDEQEKKRKNPNYQPLIDPLITLVKADFAKEFSRVGNDLGMIMHGAGNSTLIGAFHWDNKKNVAVESDAATREAILRAKIKEGDPQQLARQTHPDTLFQRQFFVTHNGSVEAKITGLSGSGKIFVQEGLPILEQANRFQPRLLAQLLNKQNQKTIEKTLGDELSRQFKTFYEVTAAKNKMTTDGRKILKGKEEGGGRED